MRVRFIYPRFQRHAEAHPELLQYVPCNEYFGPPSLGIACLAALTPQDWEVEFRDDRIEDVGLDDPVDLVAISTFTASASRAMELGDAFRARGRQVVIGGIFPTALPAEVAPHADAVVVGEGEGVWPDVLRDAAAGRLKPRYCASEPVSLDSLPVPRVDLYVDKEGGRYRPDDYPVQTGRGCPMKCFACMLPASMGRTLRLFPRDHVLSQMTQLAARGKLASLTEDTSLLGVPAVKRHFMSLLDAVVDRQGAVKFSYLGTSMPLILITPPAIFDRMRRAGINMFYLVGGFDPVTMNAFTGRDPRRYQQAIDAVRKAFDHGIEPYCSFLVGNDTDDEGTFDRMLAFAERTGIRKAEFAILTPYPGTPIWSTLTSENRIIDRNWAHYNDANVVFRPRNMTPDRLLAGYLQLWREFYRPRQSLRHLTQAERTIQF